MKLPFSVSEAMRVEPWPSVSVCAPGRLHLGFLDPAGSLGRRFGSLGLVIDGFETRIALGESTHDEVCAGGGTAQAEVGRAASVLRLLQRHTSRAGPLRLELLQVLPSHAGFGSGTQLALAIGRAFVQWHRLDVDTPRLAQWLGRGRRSGIGIAGFDRGGLIVDGGPGADGAPAVALAQLPLPKAWRVLVVQDTRQQGLSGAAERDAIAHLPPLAQPLAADICHQVLMRVLPGAAGADFPAFASGINRIQQVLGEYFAPAQGGAAFTSPAVRRLIEWVARSAEAEVATGQSSWGPTGFAILPSQAHAESLVAAAQAADAIAASLDLRIVAGRTSGASVVDQRPASRAQ